MIRCYSSASKDGHPTSNFLFVLAACLPARLGGLSLHSWHDTADAASVAGYCHAATFLRQIHDWTKDTFPSLLFSL